MVSLSNPSTNWPELPLSQWTQCPEAGSFSRLSPAVAPDEGWVPWSCLRPHVSTWPRSLHRHLCEPILPANSQESIIWCKLCYVQCWAWSPICDSIYLVVPLHFCLDLFNFLVCFKNCVLQSVMFSKNVSKMMDMLLYIPRRRSSFLLGPFDRDRNVSSRLSTAHSLARLKKLWPQ